MSVTDADPKAAAEPDGCAVPGMSRQDARLFALAAMLTIVMSVLDQNIVVTAGWPIVRDLGGGDAFGSLPWLLSAYVLAATATMPIYGALCDNLDPKRLYLFATGTFLLGSVLCGAAQNMPQLIAFRVLQGIGGGGMVSVALVILALVFPVEARAGAGAGGGLVALGIILGPLAGGFVSDQLSWRWVFWANLPIGALALAIAAGVLRLPPARGSARIDLPGVLLVVGGTVSLLLGAQWGGGKYAWTSTTEIGLLAGGALLMVLFVIRQGYATVPVIPPHLLRVRTFVVLTPVHLLAGFSVMVAPAYVGTWLQVVRGDGASRAGLTLAVMALGTLAAQLGGSRLIGRPGGLRTLLLIDLSAGIGALVLLAGLGDGSGPVRLLVALVLLGAGLGGVLQTALLAVQSAVPPTSLGSATVASRFAASLGQVCGAAVLGIIVDHHLSARRLDSDSIAQAGAAAREAALPAYVSGFHAAFVVAAVVLAVAVALVLVPRAVPSSTVPESAVPESAVPETTVPETT